MATTREPNIQSTGRDQKHNVIVTMNSFYFQVLCLNVFQFQLNSNDFHRYDDEFFVRNLESNVDKASNGASHHEGFAIYILVPVDNKCSPFSFFFGLGFLCLYLGILGFKSEQYFCWLDFFIFNLQ